MMKKAVLASLLGAFGVAGTAAAAELNPESVFA